MTPLKGFADAAVELNISESTLRHLVAARLVPFTKIGRHVKFSEQHLAQIVKNGEHLPEAPAVVAIGPRQRRRRAS